jgi:hypothetical protein
MRLAAMIRSVSRIAGSGATFPRKIKLAARRNSSSNSLLIWADKFRMCVSCERWSRPQNRARDPNPSFDRVKSCGHRATQPLTRVRPFRAARPIPREASVTRAILSARLAMFHALFSQQFFNCDREIAHSLAGRVIDRICNRWRHRDGRQLAKTLGAQRARFLIEAADE